MYDSFAEMKQGLGLKTIRGRKIVAQGVKPIGKVQWQFFGDLSLRHCKAKTGEHFFFEFSHLDTDCFQIFINLISEHYLDDLLIIQLGEFVFDVS